MITPNEKKLCDCGTYEECYNNKCTCGCHSSVSSSSLTNPLATLDVETIKLIKNSRGWNWELKILKGVESDENWIKRTFKINEEINKKYGNEILDSDK